MTSFESILKKKREESLDPNDWEAFRKLGVNAFNELVDYLKEIRSTLVWSSLPESVKQHFRSDYPENGIALSDVYTEVQQMILPYHSGNIHPRFWGWVIGSGMPQGIIADMIMSAMNSLNAGFHDCAPDHVELQVINWIKKLFGFPAQSSALLVSGCSIANLTGLKIARNATAGIDARGNGLH
jgi:aromatic-L-amino-acid/L-tryptophan decarboxylase